MVHTVLGLAGEGDQLLLLAMLEDQPSTPALQYDGRFPQLFVRQIPPGPEERTDCKLLDDDLSHRAQQAEQLHSSDWHHETALPWKLHDCSLALRHHDVIVAGGWDGVSTSDLVAVYSLAKHAWIACSQPFHRDYKVSRTWFIVSNVNSLHGTFLA